MGGRLKYFHSLCRLRMPGHLPERNPNAQDSKVRRRHQPVLEKWQQEHIDADTRALLEEDARYFLQQSLSTPCLNAMPACDGVYIEDLQGRRYMDFHGNNVHQVGFANPQVVGAIKHQLDELSFCTRRYTNRVAVDAGGKAGRYGPGRSEQDPVLPGRRRRHGYGAKIGPGGHRAPQDHLHVGFLSRSHAGHDLHRGRSHFPPGHGPSAARN